jgi:hypothetical protein
MWHLFSIRSELHKQETLRGNISQHFKFWGEIYIYYLPINKSRDISVDIMTGCGLDGRGSNPGRGKRFFSSPQRPGRLRGLPSLSSNAYRRAFTPGVKLTTHLRLVPRSRIVELYICSPHTPSWRGVYLIKSRDNFTITFIIYAGIALTSWTGGLALSEVQTAFRARILPSRPGMFEVHSLVKSTDEK